MGTIFQSVLRALLAARCVDHVIGISLTGIPSLFLCYRSLGKTYLVSSFLCVCHSLFAAVFKRNDFILHDTISPC